MCERSAGGQLTTSGRRGLRRTVAVLEEVLPLALHAAILDVAAVLRRAVRVVEQDIIHSGGAASHGGAAGSGLEN